MSLFEVNAQMTRKLSSWWLIFWKMMRRYNQRSETFYQCSPRNWPRCNNYLLNFINISKDIMLSPANNQGQKPPGLFGKAFSQSQYSPSQSMPKKNEGWALLWGKRLLHDKGNGQGTYKSRSKTIILLEIMFKKKITSITSTSIVTTYLRPSRDSELCFLKATAFSAGSLVDNSGEGKWWVLKLLNLIFSDDITARQGLISVVLRLHFSIVQDLILNVCLSLL